MSRADQVIENEQNSWKVFTASHERMMNNPTPENCTAAVDSLRVWRGFYDEYLSEIPTNVWGNA